MVANDHGLAETAHQTPSPSSSPSQDISSIVDQIEWNDNVLVSSIQIRGYSAQGEQLPHALIERAKHIATRRGDFSFRIREETYYETEDIIGPYATAVVEFYRIVDSPSVTPSPLT